MDKESDLLLLEIESLRKQLHEMAEGENLMHQLFMNNELLNTSRRLDELIIKYMKLQKK